MNFDHIVPVNSKISMLYQRSVKIPVNDWECILIVRNLHTDFCFLEGKLSFYSRRIIYENKNYFVTLLFGSVNEL